MSVDPKYMVAFKCYRRMRLCSSSSSSSSIMFSGGVLGHVAGDHASQGAYAGLS